ncbi:MAG: TIGR03619 family F420-dependent LLM class oxidoreductase [Candidatus Thorarchaeota archaeon]|nr:MAG: TIGR03619 family F420-dependent LLM class oxidoreductase [Candidatus Thorarchaeota archaeon]
MRFGFVLENYGEFLDRHHLIETAKWAEESGFSSIWATDHVLPPRINNFPRFNTITEAITTISFLAGVTDRIKLGVSTLVLPLRNPILVAKQLTSLDYLTDGRVMMSFGAGLSEGEFGFMNMSFSNRGRRFDEGLELVKVLWSGKDTFKGRHYSFEDASFSPNDPDSHRIPIWIAGNSERACRRAIKYADGWHPVNLQASEIIEKLEAWDIETPSNGFEIALRRTILDVSALRPLLDSFESTLVSYVLLKLPREKKSLRQVADDMASYV